MNNNSYKIKIKIHIYFTKREKVDNYKINVEIKLK